MSDVINGFFVFAAVVFGFLAWVALSIKSQ